MQNPSPSLLNQMANINASFKNKNNKNKKIVKTNPVAKTNPLPKMLAKKTGGKRKNKTRKPKRKSRGKSRKH